MLRFDPPAKIPSDGAARIELAANRLAAEQTAADDDRRAAGATDWYPSVADIPDEPGSTRGIRGRAPARTVTA